MLVTTDEVGCGEDVVTITPGGQQIADHPLVPGDGVDVGHVFLEQLTCPVQAAALGGVFAEGAVDESGACRYGDPHPGLPRPGHCLDLCQHGSEVAGEGAIAGIVEIGLVGKAQVMQAAVQGPGGVEPGRQCPLAVRVGAEQGTPAGPGEQGHVDIQGEALAIILAHLEFSARGAIEDVGKAVQSRALGLQAGEVLAQQGRDLGIGQAQAEPWGRAGRILAQPQGDLAGGLLQGVQLGRMLGEEVGGAVQPEGGLAGPYELQLEDSVVVGDRQDEPVEVAVAGMPLQL